MLTVVLNGRGNEQFRQMIEARLDLKMMTMAVDVVDKVSYKKVLPEMSAPTASSTHAASGVTNGPQVNAAEAGDCTGNSPDGAQWVEGLTVDWDNLVIETDDTNDGDAHKLVDESALYQALGFEANDEEAAAKAAQEYAIPCMPPDLEEDFRAAAIPVDDNESTEPLVDWDRDNPDMSVGAVYPSMLDFRRALRQYAIVHEFQLGTEKSDPDRFRGYCKANGCPWKINAKTQADTSVRIIKGRHNCASAIRHIGKMADQAWVEERAIPLLKEKSGMGAKEVQQRLLAKYNITIPYQTVWYGRQRAADKLFGKWDDFYGNLYRFKAEIELRSPGSVVEIDTVTVNGKQHFSRFFCSFKACIEGFLNGCRPYLSIDSTALNGLWNGHMPAAVAIDGHNWLFPVAFGFFDLETKENWIWFMEQLGNAIGPVPKLAICTDACKGLEKAVEKVFPWAEQRECFRHLMENMKRNFTGIEYNKYMWPAARAYTIDKHRYLLNKVLQKTPGLQEWFDKDHSLLWTRAKFSEDIKCDYINNNLAECWNSLIKELKDLPLDCMVDALREKMVILFEKRRRIASALDGNILLAVVHQLNAESKGLGHLRVTKEDPHQSEVSEIYKDEAVRRHVVYLNQHYCTCRQWQVSGKPCPHALAVITTDRQPNMEPYVDKAFSVQKLQAAYAGVIPNITDKVQWPTPDKGFTLLPPIAKKRQVGRQRKNRILGPLERSRKATRQCPLTGTKKRKRRAKKAAANPGRKKTKKDKEDEDVVAQAAAVDPAPTQLNTPRTRAAAAREAAKEKAAQEAALAKHQQDAAVAQSEGARRRLSLEAAPTPTTQAVLLGDAPPAPTPEKPPAKKMTPKK
ncbi:LOW QUALITY PROTEIN: hypothetical protein U9M48_032015, partial [Paspalum notatum var. saurae]